MPAHRTKLDPVDTAATKLDRDRADGAPVVAGASANIIGGPVSWGPASATIEGKPAKELATRLSEARLAYHRGEIGPAEYAERVEMECGR
jgi:hypothetical protein